MTEALDAPPSDEHLLRQFAGGDRAALGELALRHERALLGLAKGLLGGREDLALEAVQESWIRVIRSAGRFEGRSAVKTWLYRIVVNQCRSMAASRAASARRDRAAGEARAGAQPGEAPDELTLGVRDALARLAPDRRELLILCYHAGLTHEYAAEALEIPVGTLKSRLHAALKELRSVLSVEARP